MSKGLPITSPPAHFCSKSACPPRVSCVEALAGVPKDWSLPFMACASFACEIQIGAPSLSSGRCPVNACPALLASRCSVSNPVRDCMVVTFLLPPEICSMPSKRTILPRGFLFLGNTRGANFCVDCERGFFFVFCVWCVFFFSVFFSTKPLLENSTFSKGPACFHQMFPGVRRP